MTTNARIRIAVLALLGAMLVTIGPAWIGYQVARGDDGSGSALLAPIDAGVASAPAEAPAKPSDALHDPVSSPSAAFDDLKAAKKMGWGLLVLAVLVMACRVLGKLGGRFKALGTGRIAVVIAAVGTLAVTAYNALALGGTWMAAASAAIVAGAAFWNSHAEPKEPAKA